MQSSTFYIFTGEGTNSRNYFYMNKGNNFFNPNGDTVSLYNNKNVKIAMLKSSSQAIIGFSINPQSPMYVKINGQSLKGYKIKSQKTKNIYMFPRLDYPKEIKVYTGFGTSTHPQVYYMNWGNKFFNDNEDTVILINPQGEKVSMVKLPFY